MYGVDAKIQNLAEFALLNILAQVLMRSRNEPDVHPQIPKPTQPAKPLLLEHPENFGLNPQVHVANLVQKQGPSVAHFQQPNSLIHSAGKRAPLMAEQLGVEQLAGKACAVEVHEGFEVQPKTATDSWRYPNPSGFQTPLLRVGRRVAKMVGLPRGSGPTERKGHLHLITVPAAGLA